MLAEELGTIAPGSSRPDVLHGASPLGGEVRGVELTRDVLGKEDGDIRIDEVPLLVVLKDLSLPVS